MKLEVNLVGDSVSLLSKLFSLFELIEKNKVVGGTEELEESEVDRIKDEGFIMNVELRERVVGVEIIFKVDDDFDIELLDKKFEFISINLSSSSSTSWSEALELSKVKFVEIVQRSYISSLSDSKVESVFRLLELKKELSKFLRFDLSSLKLSNDLLLFEMVSQLS